MSINDSFAPFTPPSSVSPFDFIMNAPRTFAEHLLAPMGLASWSLSLLDGALLLIAAAAFWGLSRRRWRARLPPGNEGLPLLGESLRLIAAYKSEDPEPFIDERVRRYGRLFTTHVFGERTVFSADPQFNRLALGAEGRTVQASYPSSIATLLGAHSLVVLQGAHHKRMHSLILNRLTSPAAIRDARLLPHIDRLVRQTLAAWPARVLLLDQAKKLTFDLTLKQLVSADPGEWAESLRREYLLLIEGFFSVPLPSFLSFTTYGRAIKARKKVEAVLKEVIRKRKQENAAAAAQTDGTDSEEKMMRARKKDMLGELMEEGMTEEAMVDLLLSLLMAGYETTSTMMTMAVKFLTDNPDVLAQLREEQEGIRTKRKGGDEEAALDWSDYKSMPFTQCVINEALRVANIVSGVFRRVITDIHYNGYTIPKGCRIFLSFRAVHLDADYFVNARTFEPTRWQNSDSIPGSNVYTPFGGGSRLCPGYELARVVVSVFLHYLVTGFSWEEAEKDRLVFFPTTRTLKGYPINVRRRRRLDDVIIRSGN